VNEHNDSNPDKRTTCFRDESCSYIPAYSVRVFDVDRVAVLNAPPARAWLPYSVAAADASGGGRGGGTGGVGMVFSAEDDESWALSLEVLASW
jgi:hypothetical protein